MCSLSTTNIKFLLLFAFIIFIVLWVQSTDITVPYRRYLYGYQHSQRKNIFSTKTSRCYFHEFGCVVIYFFLSMLLWQLQNMARMVFRSLKCADVIQLLWLVSEFLELCTKIEVIMEKRLHGLSTVNYQFKLFPLRFHK